MGIFSKENIQKAGKFAGKAATNYVANSTAKAPAAKKAPAKRVTAPPRNLTPVNKPAMKVASKAPKPPTNKSAAKAPPKTTVIPKEAAKDKPDTINVFGSEMSKGKAFGLAAMLFLVSAGAGYKMS